MAQTLVSTSPQDPTDVIGEVRVHQPDEVRSVVRAATTAHRQWAATPGIERADLLHAGAVALHQRLDELTRLLVREVGKPVAEAQGEMTRAIGILRFYAQVCLDPVGEVLPAGRRGGLLVTRRRPHGVGGLITPWNSPVAIPLWKAAPALAAGNGVVIKPSPEAAFTAQALVDLLSAYLPEGLLSVVHGGAETGTALVDAVDAVSFTGSTSVGGQVVSACAVRHTPVQAEMGGHNPTIVLPDADIEAAAAQLAYSIAGYSGQKCTATRRVIIVGPAGELIDALTAALDDLALGDPAEEGTEIGPLINDAPRQQVEASIAQALGAGGARRTTRCKIDEEIGLPYVAPALLVDAGEAADILRQEVFGPVAAVIPAHDDEDAAAIANDVDFGLTAAVIGSDVPRAQRLTDLLRAGMVKINEPTTGVSFHAPFGGEKASSFGPREQGRAALDMYTSTQTLTVSPQP